jgi:hypothetical protein
MEGFRWKENRIFLAGIWETKVYSSRRNFILGNK